MKQALYGERTKGRMCHIAGRGLSSPHRRISEHEGKDGGRHRQDQQLCSSMWRCFGRFKKEKKNVRHISANLNLTPSTSHRKSAVAGTHEYYCIVTNVLICQINEGDLKAQYLPQMCLEIKGWSSTPKICSTLGAEILIVCADNSCSFMCSFLADLCSMKLQIRWYSLKNINTYSSICLAFYMKFSTGTPMNTSAD